MKQVKRDTWKDYFSFSKKERIGVAVLLSIILICFILPYFIHSNTGKPVIKEALEMQLQALQDSNNTTNSYALNKYSNQKSVGTNVIKQLSNFDPNTIDYDGLIKLGLNGKIAHTIINYRNKGGKFYKPDDIKKIYGLNEDQAKELIPYIRISSTQKGNKYNEPFKEKTKNYPKQITKKIKPIDINSATAEEWKSLPGIGDVLSNRIVKFRSKLHGFSSVQDVKRTYGLSDSAFQFILPYLSLSDTFAHKY